MSGRGGSYVLIFLLAVAGVLAYRLYVDRSAPAGNGPLAAAPQIGQQAPEISGEDVDGVTFKLSDYKGKVVALDFWGFW